MGSPCTGVGGKEITRGPALVGGEISWCNGQEDLAVAMQSMAIAVGRHGPIEPDPLSTRYQLLSARTLNPEAAPRGAKRRATGT